MLTPRFFTRKPENVLLDGSHSLSHTVLLRVVISKISLILFLFAVTTTPSTMEGDQQPQANPEQYIRDADFRTRIKFKPFTMYSCDDEPGAPAAPHHSLEDGPRIISAILGQMGLFDRLGSPSNDGFISQEKIQRARVTYNPHNFFIDWHLTPGVSGRRLSEVAVHQWAPTLDVCNGSDWLNHSFFDVMVEEALIAPGYNRRHQGYIRTYSDVLFRFDENGQISNWPKDNLPSFDTFSEHAQYWQPWDGGNYIFDCDHVGNVNNGYGDADLQDRNAAIKHPGVRCMYSIFRDQQVKMAEGKTPMAAKHLAAEHRKNLASIGRLRQQL